MGSEQNDDLVVMTHDGDIRVDPHVRQEVGMLVSDKGRYATELVHASPLYEFVDPYECPVKKGSVFILRHDTPPPEHSSRVINLVAPTVYKMAFQGQWKKSEALIDRVSHWKYGIAALSVIAFLGFAYLNFQDSRAAAERQWQRDNQTSLERAAELPEDAPAQPSFKGLENYTVREEPEDN